MRVHPVPPGARAGPLTAWAAHAERLLLCRLLLTEDDLPGAQFLAPFGGIIRTRAVLVRDAAGWRTVGLEVSQEVQPPTLRLTMAQFAAIRDAPADVAIQVMPL